MIKALCCSSFIRFPVLAGVAALTLSSACVVAPDINHQIPSVASAIDAGSQGWWRPTADQNLRWYWQLQDKLNTFHEVDVYDIDIETPLADITLLKERGVKLICYFSVGTVEEFRDDAGDFPAQVLGEVYPGFEDERWLDLSRYPEFADVMRARLDRCAEKGFDGVEGDNVDAFDQRIPDSNGVVRKGTSFGITRAQSVDYVLWLAQEAHKRGLAFGLKNAVSISAEVVDEVDWLLTESCFAYSWCTEAKIFIDSNKPVFMTEYVEYVPDFSAACSEAKGAGFNAIYRDTGLTASGIFSECL